MFKRFFRAIKRFFLPKPRIESHGESGNFKPKWGLIIPHTKDRPGASSFDGKYSEYKYYLTVAVGLSVPFQTRDDGGVFGAFDFLNEAYDCNLSVEAHYNSYNGSASGYEVLYIDGDSLSKHYAEKFLETMEKYFPKRNNRGLKKMKRGGRGYNNLIEAKRAGAKAAILPELFFGDNEKDWIDPEKAAEIINEFVKLNS